jgi:hypothetical protein
VTSRVSLALIVTALGPMIGAAFVDAPMIFRVLLAGAPLFIVGSLILGRQLWRYWRSGYRDDEWTARHDDSAPDFLELTLVSRNPQGALTAGTMEIRVRPGQRAWDVVSDNSPDNRINVERANTVSCRFSAFYTLHPGETYEVRWYGLDRGEFAEITRETFQLQVYP